MEMIGDRWKFVLLELEIDGKIVDSRHVYNGQLEWELKKMRLRAMTQQESWKIFKTVPATRKIKY